MTALRVEVLLFASVRDVVGADRTAVVLEPPADVASLRHALADRHPEIADRLPACRVAVDRAFAADDAPLAGASEVALVPPVSGG